MDELAGIAGFSKYHLSREFHRLTGYAPISYLLMIRMEHAGFLLLNTLIHLALTYAQPLWVTLISTCLNGITRLSITTVTPPR
jgi:AraC-like DNA-binding protein